MLLQVRVHQGTTKEELRAVQTCVERAAEALRREFRSDAVSAPDPFLIRAHVPDFEDIGADYLAMSAAARSRWPHVRDVPYGPGVAERLDLYFPGAVASAPVHVFLHGGYWRSGSKELYAFLADTVCAAGAIAVIVEYGLMPGTRMSAIVSQVRRSLGWVAKRIADYGGHPASLSISGHSAGAHLASFALAAAPGEPDGPAPPPVRAALLVSGIYDLEPMTRSFLQPEIRLTEDEVRRWSPCQAGWRSEAHVHIVVGEGETAPFHAQAEALEKRLLTSGVPVDRDVVAAENHMTIVRSMGRVDAPMAALLARCILRSRT